MSGAGVIHRRNPDGTLACGLGRRWGSQQVSSTSGTSVTCCRVGCAPATPTEENEE